MRKLYVMGVAAGAGALAEFAGNALGLWWVTVLAGVAVGWFAWRGALPGLLVGTVVGWAAGMLWASGGDVFPVARVVSSLALQDGSFGWAVALVTLVYALLLALAGAWLGGAARRTVRTVRTVRTDQPKESQHV